MTAPTVGLHTLYGTDLSAADLAALAARWISPDIAEAAGLRRVDDMTGKELLGRRRGSYAGIFIPYLRPDRDRFSYYRIRRDQPDVELHRGEWRSERKYLGPPERRCEVYFPPGVTVEQLRDAALPVVVTEGEFKTLALWRLAQHGGGGLRFVPIGLGGVWNWRGVIGKRTGPDGGRLDEKGPLPDLDVIECSGRKVVLAFDADAAEKSGVRAARWRLSEELRSRGAVVGVLQWDAAEGNGVDDRLARVGPETVLSDLAAVEFNRTTGWKAKLIRTQGGKAKPLLENARIALEMAPEWEGVLAYDEFSLKVVALRPGPWGGPAAGEFWTQADDLQTACWLQREGIEVGTQAAGQAVQLVAKKNTFHPVRQYLEGLRWDGVSRLDHWLHVYCGAEDDAYSQAVGRCWILSAVARAMCPGVKADNVIILEAKQGAGKSSAAEALGGRWFRKFHLSGDILGKDSALKLAGAWILELEEMDAVGRATDSAMKAFLSSATDSYRPPYASRTEDAPRSCVFVGTVNIEHYLKDSTGNRRYWPAKCGDVIDVAGLRRDRDQLFAEAVVRYYDGEAWYLEDTESLEAAVREQRARYDADPWQSVLEEWAAGRQTVTIEAALEFALEKPKQTWTQVDKNRVGRCFRALGWTFKRRRVGDGLEWAFRREE